MSNGPPKRAFVTGATGGIGSVLCERLSSEGWEVTALVRRGSRTDHIERLSGVSLVECDLFDTQSLARRMEGCNAVFHLAARVHAPDSTPVSDFTRLNVDATRSVLEAAVAAGAESFVFFSTVAVYPDTDELLDERSPAGPSTPYGASKLAAEKIVLASRDKLRVTVLRLPVVYGPRDRGNVGKLIDAIARGRFVIPGSGTNVKTMVSVDDVANAALRVATDTRAAGKTYIVADDPPLTIAQIASTIARALGKPVPRRLPATLLLAAGTTADVVTRLTGVKLPISAEQVRKLAANTRYSGRLIRGEMGLTSPREASTALALAVDAYVADTREHSRRRKDEK